MKQVGTVVSVRDGYADVLVLKTSMCGENCGSCKGGCAPGKQEVRAKIVCADSVKPSDRVLLEMGSGRVLILAAAMYLMPVLAMFAAYFVAAYFFDSELISIVSAFAAVVFVLFFVKLLNNVLKNSKKYEIHVTKVLHST